MIMIICGLLDHKSPSAAPSSVSSLRQSFQHGSSSRWSDWDIKSWQEGLAKQTINPGKQTFILGNTAQKIGMEGGDKSHVQPGANIGSLQILLD